MSGDESETESRPEGVSLPFGLEYPQALLLALVMVLVVTLIIAASTSTSAFGVYNPAWDGASELQAVADEAGTESEILRNTSEYESFEANGTVALILSPDQAYTDGEIATLREFVDRGGTLVIAEDFGPRSNTLLAGVGATARTNGTLLRDERYYYRSPALPVATNVSEHPLTENTSQLTLNYGTAVEPGGENVTVLVRSSEFSYLDTNGNATLDDSETAQSYPVATVEPVGDGRVVTVGDPSLFINAMVEREGNRAFARTLFSGHDRVILDYSHTGGIPPLSAALLTLRASPLLQTSLVVGAVLLVGVVSRRDVPGLVEIGAQLGLRPEERTAEEDDTVSPAALEAYLREQHPEWEAERIERIVASRLERERKR